jgi:CRISPR-associated protein Csy3
MAKIPAVTSFTRAFVITDGIMLNILPDGSSSPVRIIRHGIRGTQNIFGDEISKKHEPVNIQETDTAKLSGDAIGLKVNFEFRVLPLTQSLESCSDAQPERSSEFRKSVIGFIHKAAEDHDSLYDVSCRFARNITNARWLWRNRTIADSIKTTVSFDDSEYVFSSHLIPLNEFKNYSKDEERLADQIFIGLSGAQSGNVCFEISSEINFGINGSIEVYPSQNYLPDMAKGFTRSLYKYGTPDKINRNENNFVGFAAIRDQKIGNALRTIDTWYPEFNGIPIAVEPNGANISANNFFRRNDSSAFQLFSKLGELDIKSDNAKFCLACLIRGGVYSAGQD